MTSKYEYALMNLGSAIRDLQSGAIESAANEAQKERIALAVKLVADVRKQLANIAAVEAAGALNDAAAVV